MERKLAVKLGVGAGLVLLSNTSSVAVPEGGIAISGQPTRAAVAVHEDDSQSGNALPGFIVAESLYAQLGIKNDDPDKDEVLKKIFSGILSNQIKALNEQFDQQTIKRMQMKIWGVPSVNGYVFDLVLDGQKFIYYGEWMRLPDGAEVEEGEDGIIYQISDILFVPAWKGK